MELVAKLEAVRASVNVQPKARGWPEYDSALHASNTLFRSLTVSFFAVTFDRPKKLNSLCTPLIKELNDALRSYDDQQEMGAIVLTGSEKAFAGTDTRSF